MEWIMILFKRSETDVVFSIGKLDHLPNVGDTVYLTEMGGNSYDKGKDPKVKKALKGVVTSIIHTIAIFKDKEDDGVTVMLKME